MAGVRRRTQAERRAATRTALLNSTVDCLVEYGYTNVTGAQIATRAGVTRGAQAHYFATKAELVAAALEHATGRITQQFRDDPPQRATEAEAVMALVDRLWVLHDSPAFTAVVELWLASRTDAELSSHVSRLNKQMTAAVKEILTEVVPDFLSGKDGVAVMTTALAAIRGVLLTGFVAGPEALDSVWTTTRGQLEKLVRAAIEDGQRSAGQSSSAGRGLPK
ncbi:MAG TPA: TetR/AcrR family transcriptional regulator [Amycolatopsis sp.]|uniref:TetR/AcrR family transcriptional regulator n=1 Tax=Amycolatopsis sp. TaxID=37632 RepID=UPI002B4A5B10|nr:TetR/AcrR family transcriptional regulator [Amycolatopsis sp.]HKS45429.1 TetR/AcrR family transcriptional regulator [Amycolatopsis sp.]